MSDTIVQAIITAVSVVATGIIAGALSSKLISYRIDQLEEKVDKHNCLIDRMYKTESDVKILQNKVDDLHS